jgi:hypothetical protein
MDISDILCSTRFIKCHYKLQNFRWHQTRPHRILKPSNEEHDVTLIALISISNMEARDLEGDFLDDLAVRHPNRHIYTTIITIRANSASTSAICVSYHPQIMTLHRKLRTIPSAASNHEVKVKRLEMHSHAYVISVREFEYNYSRDNCSTDFSPGRARRTVSAIKISAN